MAGSKVSGIKQTFFEMFLVAEGLTAFPLHLLTKLEAFPFEQKDADHIEDSIQHPDDNEVFRVVLLRRSTKNTYGDFRLWEARGWKLVHAGSDGVLATRIASRARKGIFENRESAKETEATSCP